MLQTQKILIENDNWKEILSSAPYNLKIVEKTLNGVDYVLLKYNQIDSSFYEEVVKECRGIIFRKNDWKIVCFPFKKFFSYGGIYADTIDFDTAKVQEKVDGSIIKLWYDNAWIISTNGLIDAEEATTPLGYSFKDLFIEGLMNNIDNLDDFYASLNKDYTYIFEMVNPLSKVVIAYNKPDVYHIGTRNNITLEELDVDINIHKPKNYFFNSLEDVILMAKNLPFSYEGYVVVDKNWNRIKIKSPSYLAVSRIKNNGALSAKKIMEIILKNEQSEVLAIFPEYTEYFNFVEEIFLKFKNKALLDIEEIRNLKFESKKEFAIKATKTQISPFLFNVYDGKMNYDDFNLYLLEYGSEKLVNLLKIKDKICDKIF
ncbi:hypothetical protein M0Q97_09915 [Candidatus Dojkabacteria bacterium]|jgi:hypothetical protein|nr:hypothetical protein [Candidatus Dojkabacteria bacterium]